MTGVTGFLGAHTAHQFLLDGGFRVRGTVRDKSKASKINPLKETLGPLFDKIELVEADLTNKESLIKAISGSTYVAHTASPFYLNVSKENKE